MFCWSVDLLIFSSNDNNNVFTYSKKKRNKEVEKISF